MVSKPLRILTFIFSAFLVLAFTVGVTQAANKVFFASVGGVVGKNVSTVNQDPSATVDPSQTLEPSMTPDPSSTPEPTKTSESKVEFSGVITAIELEWWTIGDFVVQVTADTEVEGDPVVGDFVSVEAFLQPDGSYIAHEISKDDDSEDSEDSEHMTGTPGHDDSDDDDHDELTSTPEMHDDEEEGDDDEHEENGSGSSEDEHDGGSDDHDGGGSGDHGGGGDD